MNNITFILGSQQKLSRSESLAEICISRLSEHGININLWRPSDFPPGALLNIDYQNSAVKQFHQDVHRADAIVVISPVYQASFSGALKCILDLVPKQGFSRKLALPITHGGSQGHQLVLDYALRPVLVALEARLILKGVHAIDQLLPRNDAGLPQADAAIHDRVTEAANALIDELRIGPSRLFERRGISPPRSLRADEAQHGAITLPQLPPSISFARVNASGKEK